MPLTAWKVKIVSNKVFKWEENAYLWRRGPCWKGNPPSRTGLLCWPCYSVTQSNFSPPRVNAFYEPMDKSTTHQLADIPSNSGNLTSI